MDFDDTPEEATFRAEVNAWLAERRPSDTVTTTGYLPALVNDSVPEMRPVVPSTVNCAGNPVAL